MITIVSAIGFLQNANYQREYDLRFDVRGSIIAWIDNKSEFETYRNALQEDPEILSIAGAGSCIFSAKAHEPVKHEAKQTEVDIIAVGDNYLKTMDLKLIQGRDFIKILKQIRRNRSLSLRRWPIFSDGISLLEKKLSG